MTTIKISKDEVQELVFGDSTELYEFVEGEEWVDDGKYSYCETIVRDVTTNQYYRFYVSRSGSYFTDYYYDWEDQKEYEAEEVHRVTKTIKVWEKVDVNPL